MWGTTQMWDGKARKVYITENPQKKEENNHCLDTFCTGLIGSNVF